MYKIVWALDPFDFNSQVKERVQQILRGFLQKTPVLIQPIYVFSEADLDQYSMSEAVWKGRDTIQSYHKPALKVARNACKQLGLREVLDPQILFQNSPSQAEGVELLSNYGHISGADTILVSTHGRSGISRLVLGSFAEALILRSKVPVLVIRTEAEEVSPLNSILFPTDFNVNARWMFRRVVGMARRIHAEMILYHSIPHPIEPFLQSGVSLLGGGTWIPLDYYYSEEMERQEKRAKAWARWAENQGVQTKPIINSYSEPIADSIIALSRKETAGLIAMEEQTGPIAAALVGSTTRQVIRQSDCPVWVVRASMPDQREVQWPFVQQAA